jgi:hypothetical protein
MLFAVESIAGFSDGQIQALLDARSAAGWDLFQADYPRLYFVKRTA